MQRSRAHPRSPGEVQSSIPHSIFGDPSLSQLRLAAVSDSAPTNFETSTTNNLIIIIKGGPMRPYANHKTFDSPPPCLDLSPQQVWSCPGQRTLHPCKTFGELCIYGFACCPPASCPFSFLLRFEVFVTR